MFRRYALAFSLAVLVAAGPASSRASAAGPKKIAVLNVSGQAGITLVSAAIRGKIHGVRDVVRCVWTGAASGYGLFQAKRLTGNGHRRTGWILANVAGSLSENAAAGKHPFAQVGYSIGPFRLRVPVPGIERNRASHVYVDVSAYETVMLLIAAHGGGHVTFGDGLIAFRRDKPYDDPDLAGLTFGVVPTMWDTGDVTRSHETIHAIQSLHGDLVEPGFAIGPREPDRDRPVKKSLVRFGQFKLGLLNAGNLLVIKSLPYEKGWVEIEAYRLADKGTPYF